MKKHITVLLCLVLALSLGACSGPVGLTADGLTLDVDYITSDARQAEPDEEGPSSLFGLMQQRLRADAQPPPPAGEITQADGGQGALDTQQAAGRGAGQAPAGRRSTPGADEAGEMNGQAGSGGGDGPATDDPAVQGQSGTGSGEGETGAPQRNTVTLQIRVDTAVAIGMHEDPQWAGIVPPSGVILPRTTFEFQDGDTVYDVLRQAGRAHGISISSRGTTFGVYIEGINGLFEFDGGPLSGWMYSVNDWYPNFGAAVYFLQPGDRIEWNYTTDLGRDLGVDMASW